MATKRTSTVRPARSPNRSAATRRAAAAGRQVAARVLRERAGALRSRATAIAKAPRRARALARPIDPRFIQAAGPKGIATLVAEGDSWFDYLWYDILDTRRRAIPAHPHLERSTRTVARSSGPELDGERLLRGRCR